MDKKNKIAEHPSIASLSMLANRVESALSELRDELDAIRRPNNLALRSLGIDRMGWTQYAYSDEAFRIWSQMRKNDQRDIEALHHLAIMHHARAIDLEESDDPVKSNEDWEQAMEYWYRLWDCDEFWEALAESTCQKGKTEPVEKLRQNFPKLLLSIHYDLAIHRSTRRSRANYHISRALKSPFSKEVKEKTRNLAYERFANLIPETIWQTANPEIAEAERALAIIRKFLEYDSGCINALADALCISVKVLRTRFTDINALGDDDSERSEVFTYLKKLADSWFPYFEQLSKESGNLEENTRRNLCLWCRVNGEVMEAKELLSEAIRFLRLGASVGIDVEDEARICQRKMCLLEAVHARSLSESNSVNARAACDQLQNRDDLPILAHLVLAQAYMNLKAFDFAEAVCDKGLQKEPDYDMHRFTEEDEQALQSLESLRNMVQAMADTRKAQQLMEAQSFEAAIPLLDRALERQPGYAMVHFLRAQCRLVTQDFEGAFEDVNKFRDSAIDQKDNLAAADRLEDEIKKQRDTVRLLGPRAVKLMHKAERAAEKADEDSAISLLRQALATALPKGQFKIREKLVIALCNCAIGKVNELMKNKNLDAGRAQEIKRYRAMLKEACRLEPGNGHARENLHAVEELLRNLKVNNLRQAAADAFNAHDFDEAIRCQEQALAAANYRDHNSINKDLAAIIAAKAVYLVNSLQDKISLYPISIQMEKGSFGFLSAQQNVFNESAALLEKAAMIDPSNDNIKENLRAIQQMVSSN
jgi:hypothetical protein